MLTQKALNPFVECTSGLVGGEGLSIILKLGLQRSIEHIRFLKDFTSRRHVKSWFGQRQGERLQSDLTDSVMIARDESPECWHAVSAAIPFMHLAKSVRVISVDRDASNRQASQAEVLAYLRCHGIGATAQVVAPELRSVRDTLAAGAEHEAGLLVMGAYSHSRLREMLLGGATRHILKNASARPVLLAH